VVGSHLEGNIKIEYVFQKQNDIPSFVKVPSNRIKPWGTGHALYSVRNRVDDDFLIINADDFYGRDAFQKVADYFNSTNGINKACMVGYKLKNTLTDEGTVNRGVCKVEDGFLIKVDERLKIKEENGIVTYQENEKTYTLDENSIVSVNTWGFSKEIFNYLDEELNKFFKENINNLETAEFMLPTVIQNLINKDIIKLRVFNTDSKWMGVTYKEDVDKVKEGIKRLVKEGVYPEKLWK
jgi:choline kinase